MVTCLSPERINSVLRKIAAIVHDKELVVLPEDERTTDLNIYYGDLLRSNLRYHLIHNAGIDEGELSYILGIHSEYTICEYYIDYADPVSQLEIKKKMEIWVGTIYGSALKKNS